MDNIGNFLELANKLNFNCSLNDFVEQMKNVVEDYEGSIFEEKSETWYRNFFGVNGLNCPMLLNKENLDIIMKEQKEKGFRTFFKNSYYGYFRDLTGEYFDVSEYLIAAVMRSKNENILNALLQGSIRFEEIKEICNKFSKAPLLALTDIVDKRIYDDCFNVKNEILINGKLLNRQDKDYVKKLKEELNLNHDTYEILYEFLSNNVNNSNLEFLLML